VTWWSYRAAKSCLERLRHAAALDPYVCLLNTPVCRPAMRPFPPRRFLVDAVVTGNRWRHHLVYTQHPWCQRLGYGLPALHDRRCFSWTLIQLRKYLYITASIKLILVISIFITNDWVVMISFTSAAVITMWFHWIIIIIIIIITTKQYLNFYRNSPQMRYIFQLA